MFYKLFIAAIILNTAVLAHAAPYPDLDNCSMAVDTSSQMSITVAAIERSIAKKDKQELQGHTMQLKALQIDLDRYVKACKADVEEAYRKINAR